MPEPRAMIVTGASSGIGRELVRAAGREGWSVLAVARRAERLQALAGEVRCAIGATEPLALDICSPDAAKRIADTALARFGRIDVIVHNAGSASPGPLLEQSDAALDGQWQLHVPAPLRVTREALPALQRSSGQVIFIGSGVARVPTPNFGAYSAAKAAIRAAAIQLRRELRGTGIAVTYVDPGSVDTEFSEASGMERSAPRWLLAKPQRVAARIMRAVRRRPRTLNASPLQTLGVTIGERFPWLADRVMSRIVDKPKRHEASTRDTVPPPRASPTPYPTPRPQPPEPRASPTPEPQPQPPPPAAPSAQAEAMNPDAHAEVSNHAASDFERALEPIARRLERVKLPKEFLASLLHEGGQIHLTDAAMRWAGMPNKNERAAMNEALEVLAAAGFLRTTGAETWQVVRPPE